MPWIALYIGVAVLGLAVLAALSLRLWHQVKDFGRQVSAAGEQIGKVTDALARIEPPRP